MLRKITLVAMSLMIAFAFGCAKKQTAKTGASFAKSMKGAPEWAYKGCSAFSGEKKKWICGVGVMGGTNNLAMCGDMATARGRQQIAETMNLGFAGLTQDYQQTMTGGAAYGKAADDEQLSRRVAEQLTEISLPGTRVEDMYFSDNGECFSLVVLDLHALETAISGVTGLDAGIKEHITRNAEKAFDDLHKRLQKPPKSGD